MNVDLLTASAYLRRMILDEDEQDYSGNYPAIDINGCI